MKRLRYKEMLVNYIGGLGYCSLLAGVTIWAVSLVAALRLYIIPTGVRIMNDPVSSSAAHGSIDDGANLLVRLVASFIIIVFVACMLMLPYGVARHGGVLSRALLKAAGLRDTSHVLYKIKITTVCIVALVIFLGSYNFTLPPAENSYAIFALSWIALAAICFSVQHIAAKYISLPYSKIR